MKRWLMVAAGLEEARVRAFMEVDPTVVRWNAVSTAVVSAWVATAAWDWAAEDSVTL
jgi:hypothetical protein